MPSNRVELRSIRTRMHLVDDDESLKKLVTFVKLHPDLLGAVVHCIRKFSTLERFEAGWVDFKTFLRKSISREFRRHNDELFGLVEAFFRSSAVQASTNANPLDEQEYLDFLRGRAAELLVGMPLQARYIGYGGVFVDNAVVSVDGAEVRLGKRKSVDVAGIRENPEEGSFYEVKVAPARFDDEDLQYLRLLRLQLFNVRLEAAVGGATLYSREMLKADSSYVKLRAFDPELVWLGWEDIEDLRFSR